MKSASHLVQTDFKDISPQFSAALFLLLIRNSSLLVSSAVFSTFSCSSILSQCLASFFRDHIQSAPRIPSYPLYEHVTYPYILAGDYHARREQIYFIGARVDVAGELTYCHKSCTVQSARFLHDSLPARWCGRANGI